MPEAIKKMKEEGFIPVIYINSDIAKYADPNEIEELSRKAQLHDLKVYNELDIWRAIRRGKLYVLRYGSLYDSTAIRIKQKGGKIVPGYL